MGLAKQIRAAGLSMPYGNLAIDEGTAKTMGDTAAGMYMSASYLTSIDNAQNPQIPGRAESQVRRSAKTANDLSEPQYEGFYLYKAAVEQAGGMDAQKIVAALSQVSFDARAGWCGGAQGGMPPAPCALTMRLGQVQQDGSIKILQTFENVDPGAQCPDLKVR